MACLSPTQQALKCTKEVMQCCDCLKWRCIYAAKKMTNEEKQTAVKLIENLLYTCGASLQAIEVNDDDPEAAVVQKLYVSKKLTCASAIEIPS